MQEARKIKSSHENVELLKEKLLEEKRCRERAELELLRLSEIEMTVTKLQDQLSAWKSSMKDIPGISCADDMPVKFAALQKYVPSSQSNLWACQFSSSSSSFFFFFFIFFLTL